MDLLPQAALIEPSRLLENPDPKRIEQAAIWQLSRALNIGRVIAFIGSGVPMAYGRITWQNLVVTLARETLQDLEQWRLNHLELKSGPKWNRLESLANRIKILMKETAGADQYPTLFQLAELMDKETTTKERPARLRQLLATLLYDDRGQARELLKRALPKLPEKSRCSLKWFGEDDDVNLQRTAIDADSEARKESHRFRFLFTQEGIKSLSDSAQRRITLNEEARLSEFVLALRKVRGVRDSKDEPVDPVLSPLHRFATAALLRLADFKGRIELANAALAAQNYANKNISPTLSRHDHYEAHRDPLWILHHRLSINRFLTTNYDLDIERMFRDVGYTTNADVKHDRWVRNDQRPARTDRTDGLGGRSRDVVLTRSDHGRLLDFATQDRIGRPQTIHLHGRATEGDGDDVVVTEQDYQALYQRNDKHRQPMDIARRVTFGGNPLLFVGLGMGEDDILRPLRQFMGQESRLGDRLAVAIMPGKKRAEERLLEQMTLLNRYGVHAIYFGAATLADNTDEIDDWMARVVAIAEAVLKVDNAYDRPKFKNSDLDERNAVEDSVREALKALKKVWLAASGESVGIVKSNELIAPAKVCGLTTKDTPLGPKVDGLDLAFELNVLSKAVLYLRQVLRRPELNLEKEDDAFAAIGIAAEGVINSLYSTCLSARLLQLGKQWDEWKSDWFKFPEPRDISEANPALFTLREPNLEIKLDDERHWFTPGAELFRRHLVWLPQPPKPTDIDIALKTGESAEHVWPDRFHANPPSRAMHDLYDGLREQGSGFWSAFTGRRTFLLLARRGAGKGHVFSSLASREGLPRFLAASWGKTAVMDRAGIAYAGAAFYSLSFSHEVATIFDRLSSFLFDQWKRVFEPDYSATDEPLRQKIQEELDRQWVKLVNDRRGRLRHVLHAYQRAAIELPSPKRRVLVALGNPSTLYDGDGTPKNTGLHRLFDTLLQAEFAAAPIDFVLFCSAQAVPPQFRRRHTRGSGEEKTISPMLRISAPGGSAPERLANEETERALGLIPVADTLPLPPPIPRNAPIIACHILRPANPLALAAAFFPRVALAWAESENILPEANGLAWVDVVLRQKKIRDEMVKSEVGEFDEAAARELKPQDQDKIIATFDLFARKLSANRLGSTLLMAAADEQIGPREAGYTVDSGKRAAAFLEQAEIRLLGTPDRQKDASIVELVLGAMQQRHLERCAPPLGLRVLKQLGPQSHRLLLDILWHVAVIGGPVEASVLAECPEVKTSLKATLKAREECLNDESEDPNEELRLLRDALDLLVHRCLLFVPATHKAVESAKPYETEKESGSFVLRYGVHRLLQRMIFRLLDSPMGLYPALDRFSLSLYYAQPSDLPRPTFEAHLRLRGLVEALSGYPDEDFRQLKTEAKLKQASERLRAAYGVICSVYHAAIIGRFDEYDSQDSRTRPTQGYIESHRLLVRNLLRQAIAIDEACEREQKKVVCRYIYKVWRPLQTQRSSKFPSSHKLPRLGRVLPSKKVKRSFNRPLQTQRSSKFPSSHKLPRLRRVLLSKSVKRSFNVLRPFYAEEIVWLLNETGVLSLAQGRLNDATVLFAQAAAAAEKWLAPNGGGALRVRIDLNAAIADIERGASPRTRERLERILNIEDEDDVVRGVAQGLLGLTEHLAGELKAAEDHYSAALVRLLHARNSRAASIFQRMLGDVYRARGAAHFAIAEEKFNTAESLARDGSHEDVAQLARLAHARLMIEQGQPDQLISALHDLDGIERYARNVGLPRISAELATIRSEAVLRLGETHRAAELAADGLEVATLHDMRMYKVRALAAVAAAFAKLDVGQSADLVRRRAEELARRSHYSSMAKRLSGPLPGGPN
jgi:hypothetical protein